MAAVPTPDIQYYLKETTNQILVSGSSPINDQLNAIKDPVTVANSNYTTKISALGDNISYVVQNGEEFTNLILNNPLQYNPPTTTVNNTAFITRNGSLNGVGAEFKLKSTFSLINSITVTDIGSGYQVGETITFTQGELLLAGFLGVSNGIVITLSENNIVASSTEIPLRNDQELWVYRGYNTDGGDGNTYRYNPHLHRPYKAYIVTETSSGSPTNPYLPEGGTLFTADEGSNVNISNVYIEGTLGRIGNGVLNGVTQVNQPISGSFVVHHEEMQVVPFVFTQYNTISQNPPAAGAVFRVYKENTTSTGDGNFSTGTTPPPLNGRIKYNNTDVNNVSEIYVGQDDFTFPIYQTLLTLSSSVEIYNKDAGKIKVADSNDFTNNVEWDIDGLESVSSTNSYVIVSVSNPQVSAGYSPLNNTAPIKVTLSEYSDLKYTINQFQNQTLNSQPTVGFNGFRNGDYTYTSSFFSTSGTVPNANDAIGTSQFGLCSEYNYFVRYRISYDNPLVGEDPITVNFSSSTPTLIPNTFDLEGGFYTDIDALIGTLSVSGYSFPLNQSQEPDGTYTSDRLNIQILNRNVGRGGLTPPDFFATRWSDAYISFSQSLSSSIDGLYIFNQLPQNDVQVTASMFLAAWTGSDDEGAKYATAIYNTDVYGEGEAGDGPTWPTASIRLYTGSYPFDIPTTANDFVTESLFKNDSIHLGGYAITMSYLIPSQSINIKDCLSLALQVSSGSANSASVENSLVVRHYELEFNTPPGPQTGDGLVPTFIENAFSGSFGFDKAPECQPFLNNVTTERINKEIQIVNYSTDAYTPINFQPILSGSAQKSSVPASNYTQLTSINPRYDGSRSNSQIINLWSIGDTGTFGKKPNIELKDAFFGYFSDIDDPYPNINGLTKVNLSYLIDEQGNALPPTLEDQLSIDTYNAVFPPTTTGRLAARDGKDQFKQLGKPSNIKSIMNYVTPILYTQNSGNNYVATMSLSGSGYISRYDNEDGQGQIFGRFVAEGQAIPEPTGGQLNDQYVDYIINPTESVQFPEGSLDPSPWNYGPYADSGTAYYDTTRWGTNRKDLSNEQIITLKHSFVTSFVSETGGTGQELQFQLKMFDDNAPGSLESDKDQPFNLEDITCRVYTIDGSSTDIGSVLNFGWFGMSNIEGYREEIIKTNLGNINVPRWLRSRVPIRGDGINCVVNWEMYETLYDYGLMRERAPRGNGGVIGLEWTITANSGKYTIKGGSKIRWKLEGSFKDSRGGFQQGFFFPSTYTPTDSNPYTSATIKGVGAYDHLLDEANTAQAPFWVVPTQFIDNNWSTYTENGGNSGTSVNQVLIMQSPNLNEAYGTDFKQGDTPYIPGPSPYFPGGMEPEGTAFDRIENTILLKEGDEIRFANNENYTYTITQVSAPAENLMTNGGVTKGRLRIVLDRDVNQELNFDFFFIRRPITVANTLYLERQFPYAALASASLSQSIVSFTGSENKPNVANEGNIGLVYSSGDPMSGSYTASFSSLESATTPGILFPDYPTDYLIESASIIVNDLITRRIIES